MIDEKQEWHCEFDKGLGCRAFIDGGHWNCGKIHRPRRIPMCAPTAPDDNGPSLFLLTVTFLLIFVIVVGIMWRIATSF